MKPSYLTLALSAMLALPNFARAEDLLRCDRTLGRNQQIFRIYEAVGGYEYQLQHCLYSNDCMVVQTGKIEREIVAVNPKEDIPGVNFRSGDGARIMHFRGDVSVILPGQRPITFAESDCTSSLGQDFVARGESDSNAGICGTYEYLPREYARESAENRCRAVGKKAVQAGPFIMANQCASHDDPKLIARALFRCEDN